MRDNSFIDPILSSLPHNYSVKASIILVFSINFYIAFAKFRINIHINHLQTYSRQYSGTRDTKQAYMAPKKESQDSRIIIKRYGNRRLYNTETKSYVTYRDLLEIIRAGHDIQVIDSTTKADVTKAVLIQVILEEEKNQKPLLPLPFLFQLIRSQESAAQDFFTNYLSTSFEAYLKTKEEFDRRFRGWLEMTASAPQIWEQFIPGAETMREIFNKGKKKE